MSKKLEQLRITAAAKGSGVISVSIEELNQVDTELVQFYKENERLKLKIELMNCFVPEDKIIEIDKKVK